MIRNELPITKAHPNPAYLQHSKAFQQRIVGGGGGGLRGRRRLGGGAAVQTVLLLPHLLQQLVLRRKQRKGKGFVVFLKNVANLSLVGFSQNCQLTF